MANIQTGEALGIAVCKVLGIDPSKVSQVSIRMAPGRAATVGIHRYIDADEAKAIEVALEQYTLEQKQPDPQASAMETIARNLTKG